MAKEKILIVEDEQEIRDLIYLYLLNYGYEVILAADGREGMELFQQNNPDLILLDILMPHMDGMAFCQEIRKVSNIPIIFISCKKESEDIIFGLELGADDYITKPFDPQVLVARVQANLRRAPIYRRNSASPSPTLREEDYLLKFNELEINLNNYEVHVNGSPVSLPAKELHLLVFLAQHPDQVFTTEQLYQKIWDSDSNGDTRTVMVHISNIRKKIESNPSQPIYIQNIRGVGYKFLSQSKLKK